ncbi:MAG: 30S ribosomal protein S21 [Parcubacteria group bacterium GW2011_GWA2_43_9b]|uniref:Small ribosomal subunit protein bS21 n=1 Tax=Candidatus Portnoybacteria bacterium RIFCSPLOWO2_02_FULL_39_11 TaxID=1802001 RepID=A0A1G2FUT7_9BACT|nr:MAG: 30S ribosomal protein S21 [Parcubacteria group bacterium GW2011_GWA2_43_9b]OGZ41833.1 MAG: 30S ribosomal protein S21 [Candidatus Portnoybacteria bacterium RIFCSPLOWO2_02_FULL_39_11]
MAIEVRRKEKEPVGSLLRRFTRRVQQSGVLLSARKGRFYQKPKTKRQTKASALRREQLRAQRRDMMKEGLLEEGQLIPKELIRIKKK